MADNHTDNKSDTKVLVTGATGFIGTHLVKRLYDLGYKIRTFGRSSVKSHHFDDLDIEHLGGDITNPPQVMSAAEGCQIIFHLAGLVSYRRQDLQRQFGVNVLGTRHVMEAALEHSVKRVIHTSSVAAMGIPRAGQIGDETLEYNLLGKGLNYCDSKYEAELQVRHFYQNGVPAIILNPGIVFGEGDTHPHHHAIFASMSKGGLLGVPPGGVTFSDINDVIDAHIKAIDMGRTGERYALVSANLTFKEAAIIFSNIFATRPPKMVIPGSILVALGALAEGMLPALGVSSAPLTRQAAWLSQHKIFFSSQKAIDELDFHQTPFEETIRRTNQYYQEYGRLHAGELRTESDSENARSMPMTSFVRWLLQFWV